MNTGKGVLFFFKNRNQIVQLSVDLTMILLKGKDFPRGVVTDLFFSPGLLCEIVMKSVQHLVLASPLSDAERDCIVSCYPLQYF